MSGLIHNVTYREDEEEKEEERSDPKARVYCLVIQAGDDMSEFDDILEHNSKLAEGIMKLPGDQVADAVHDVIMDFISEESPATGVAIRRE
ncbi:hypothetical protein Fmac_002327 [Flemingia macrophylla]|uniref:Uncharacterized protein n=1 Tax=Flemingia macrophylla TaxID=520843 RepID=A0ABD1NJL3_9FABA